MDYLMLCKLTFIYIIELYYIYKVEIHILYTYAKITDYTDFTDY